MVLPHRGAAGLSDWSHRIKGDDKTCPSKLGQSPRSPADDSQLYAKDKTPKQTSGRSLMWIEAHCFLKQDPRGCS